ncbi:hypothetical protein CG423_26560, partial [Shigella flexneri]
ASLVEEASAAAVSLEEQAARLTEAVNVFRLNKQSDARENLDNCAIVFQAISEMDKVTQQNASLVEEASAAAVSLEEQAARLTEAVNVFRLNK